MLSRRVSPVLAAALLLAVPSCRDSSPPELRIGLLATFTGPYGEISGLPTREGAVLAARLAGPVTIAGRRYRVTFHERDFADRADAAAGAARALINQQRVVALVGPQFSRHAIPVAVLAENARVPMISPMSSNPAVTAGKRFVFRLAFLDDVQGAVLARFAREDLRARTAAVLYDVTTAYSRDLAERFRRAFTGGGGRIVGFEAYTADRLAELDAPLRRIAARAPDVLFLPNFADGVAEQIPRIQRLGIRARLLGSDSWDPPSMPALNPGQEAYVTNQWRPDIPRDSARAFGPRFREAYGVEPRATAAMTYDAVRILLDAIRRANSVAPDAVRDAIAATRGYDGASGLVSFDGRADPVRSVAVSRVLGPTLVTARIVEP